MNQHLGQRFLPNIIQYRYHSLREQKRRQMRSHYRLVRIEVGFARRRRQLVQSSSPQRRQTPLLLDFPAAGCPPNLTQPQWDHCLRLGSTARGLGPLAKHHLPSRRKMEVRLRASRSSKQKRTSRRDRARATSVSKSCCVPFPSKDKRHQKGCPTMPDSIQPPSVTKRAMFSARLAITINAIKNLIGNPYRDVPQHPTCSLVLNQ